MYQSVSAQPRPVAKRLILQFPARPWKAGRTRVFRHSWLRARRAVRNTSTDLSYAVGHLPLPDRPLQLKRLRVVHRHFCFGMGGPCEAADDALSDDLEPVACQAGRGVLATLYLHDPAPPYPMNK